MRVFYSKIILSLIYTIIGANSLCLANTFEKTDMLTVFCAGINEQNIGANVMRRIIYLPNQEINGLIYIAEAEPYVRKNGARDRKARFKCGCGNEFETTIQSVKKGDVQSCGCLASKLASERLQTHGFSQLPIYRVWKNIKERCYKENHKSFKDYGGRGIEVCEAWLNDPASFVNWAFENGYKKGLQVDRINNDGNYEPSNCRFVTVIKNSRNRRSTKITEKNISEIIQLRKANPKITAVSIASKYNVHPKTISKILRKKVKA